MTETVPQITLKKTHPTRGVSEPVHGKVQDAFLGRAEVLGAEQLERFCKHED